MFSYRPEMVLRAEYAQTALDHFRDKAFELGRFDCVRLCAAHLKRCGLRVQLARGGSYKSLLGARRALARAGYATLAEALDGHGLARIAPAEALPSDIIELPSEDVLGALGIALGNGRVLAYHPDAVGAEVLQPLEQISAWRVPVRAERAA